MAKNVERIISLVLDEEKETTGIEKVKLLSELKPNEQIDAINRSSKDYSLIRYIPLAKEEVQMAALEHNGLDYKFVEPTTDAVLEKVQELEAKYENTKYFEINTDDNDKNVIDVEKESLPEEVSENVNNDAVDEKSEDANSDNDNLGVETEKSEGTESDNDVSVADGENPEGDVEFGESDNVVNVVGDGSHADEPETNKNDVENLDSTDSDVKDIIDDPRTDLHKRYKDIESYRESAYYADLHSTKVSELEKADKDEAKLVEDAKALGYTLDDIKDYGQKKMVELHDRLDELKSEIAYATNIENPELRQVEMLKEETKANDFERDVNALGFTVEEVIDYDKPEEVLEVEETNEEVKISQDDASDNIDDNDATDVSEQSKDEEVQHVEVPPVVEVEDTLKKPLSQDEVDKINNKTDKNLIALHSKELGIIFMPENITAESDGRLFTVDWDDEVGNKNEFRLPTKSWEVVDLSESKFTSSLLSGNTNEALTEFIKEFYIPDLVVDDKFKVDDLFKDKNDPNLSKIKTEMALYEKDFKNGFKIKDVNGNRTVDFETPTWSRIAVSEFLNHLDNTTVAADVLAYEMDRQYSDLGVPADVQEQIEALKSECKDKMIEALKSNESTADNTKLKAEMESYHDKAVDALTSCGWNFRNFNLVGFLIEGTVKLIGRHWITKGATTDFERKARLKAFGSSNFNAVASYARQYSRAYEKFTSESTKAGEILTQAETKIEEGKTPGQIYEEYSGKINELIDKTTDAIDKYDNADVKVDKDDSLGKAVEDFSKEWDMEHVKETGDAKVDDVLKELNDLKKLDNDKDLKAKSDRVNDINDKLKSDKLQAQEKSDLKNELTSLKKDFENAKDNWKTKESEVYNKFKELDKDQKGVVRKEDPDGKKLMRADNDKIDTTILAIDSALDSIDKIDVIDNDESNPEVVLKNPEDVESDNVDYANVNYDNQDIDTAFETPEDEVEAPVEGDTNVVDVKDNSDYQKLLDENAKLKQENADLRQENADLKAKISELEAKLDKVANEVETLNEKVGNLEKDNQELRAELSDKNDKVEALSEKVDNLKTELFDKNAKNEFETKLENLKLEFKEKYGDKFDSSIMDKVSLDKGTKSEIDNISKAIDFVIGVQDGIASDPNKDVEVLAIKGDKLDVNVTNGDENVNYRLESKNSDGHFDTFEVRSLNDETIMRVETDGANFTDKRFIREGENVNEILARRVEKNGKGISDSITRRTDFAISKIEIPSNLLSKKQDDLTVADVVGVLEGISPEKAEEIIENAQETATENDENVDKDKETAETETNVDFNSDDFDYDSDGDGVDL